MEDRVRNYLDREYSRRYRAMCYRNDSIERETNALTAFYENQMKV